MAEHYYSKNQSVDSKPKFWDFELRNVKFRFKSDNGVFSKSEVDFGSRVLIDSFQIPSINGDVLDVGCGYGPIGLSLAKLMPERTVHMVDVNERALELSRENAHLNRVSNVKVYESDRLMNIEQNEFAAIVTNPPIRAGKQVIFDIYEQSYEKLSSGGSLWVVIQKKQGAPSTMDKLESLFGNVEVVTKEKGYFILHSKKD